MAVLVAATAGLAVLGMTCQGADQNPPDTTPIPGGGAWRSFKKMPVPLHEGAAAVLDGKLYLVGGRLPAWLPGRTDDSAVSTLWRYDPATDSWAQLASHPGTAVDHMAAIGVEEEGLLYVMGGTIEFPGPSITEMHAYDPDTNMWSTLAPLPRRQGAMGVAYVNGKIYTFGGLSGDTGPNTIATNYVFEYDIASDEWTDLTSTCPMPTSRDHFLAATVNGKVHCIGGRSVTIDSIKDVHEVFDPATGNWSTAAPLPTPRGGYIVAVLNDKILVMGGEGANNSIGVFPENEQYDPVSDTWQTLSPMKTPRHATQGGTIGDVVYVPAGSPAIGRTYTDVNEGFSFAFE